MEKEKIISYLPLDALATTLGLPKGYLKDLAAQNKIPSLNVRGRLRFDIEQVRFALNRMAEGGQQ